MTNPVDFNSIDNLLISSASTNVATQFLRSALYGTESVLNSKTGNYDNLMDFMNYNVLNAIVKSSTLGTVIWDGTKPLTTIAYNTYGSTTHYWLIIAFNGFTSVDDIPLGTSLELPALSLINGLIDNTNTTLTSNIGQITSI